MGLTFASYNIHSCVGVDGIYSPERILSVIRALDADVIALQEVQATGADGRNLVAFFQGQTGYEALLGPTLMKGDGHYGNLLLTRGGVAGSRRIDLSQPGREPRGAVDADLEFDGLGLRVIATHLGLRPWERRAQIKALLQLFLLDPARPGVLLGDFNEWFAWGRPLRWVHRHFGYMPALPTFPSRLPVFALDRIWFHPPEALVTMKTIDSGEARTASDHLPVKAVAEFREVLDDGSAHSPGAAVPGKLPRRLPATRTRRHDHRESTHSVPPKS